MRYRASQPVHQRNEHQDINGHGKVVASFCSLMGELRLLGRWHPSRPEAESLPTDRDVVSVVSSRIVVTLSLLKSLNHMMGGTSSTWTPRNTTRTRISALFCLSLRPGNGKFSIAIFGISCHQETKNGMPNLCWG